MKPMRGWLLPLIAVALASGLVPGGAWAARVVRDTGEFQSIVSHAPVQLRVRQGERSSVEIEGDDEVIAQLQTLVEQGSDGPVLRIDFKRGARLRSQRPAIVHVVARQLQAVALRGAGDLFLEALRVPAFRLSIAGSGDARLQGLETEQLAIGISGSGGVKGEGRTQRLSLSIAGSGQAQLRGISATRVEVSIAGSGDAEVHADQTLDVSIAGSGDVRHAGAAVARSTVQGSGTVKPMR
jgi:hypothetical protein